ncbi:MAG: PilZ domain-containing protein [Candidatus Omnitrophota bacterium]|jgi:anti-anti-sigma factor
MDIRVGLKNGIIIMELIGKVDVDSANFIETVGQCLRDGYTDILCNFEEVESVDYMGISVVIIAYKEVVNNNGRMRFCCIPSHLRNVFSVSGLDRTIEMYPSLDLAENSFREDRIIEKIRKMQLRRRFKRLPLDIKAELEYAGGKAHADILNLSAVGAYVYGVDKLKLGDAVVLKIKLPPKQEDLELEAKVVWLPDKQIQKNIFPGMGVEFCNLSCSGQEKLISFIERNLSCMSSEDQS